jgi:hypothetical protein
MSATEPRVEMDLEVQIIPVSEVDRAKGFYEQLGWRLDDDAVPFDALRIVQSTPPGSGGSPLPRRARPRARSSCQTLRRLMTGWLAVASRSATCGTVRRSLPRRANPASTPSEPATGLSAPSTIPTAIFGSSRRSRRGSRAGSDWRRN